jgi:hypothetical protein
MINKVKLNIELESNELSDFEIFDIYKSLTESNIDFELLDKLFFIKDRKYFITSVENLNLDSNDNKFSIRTININIVG